MKTAIAKALLLSALAVWAASCGGGGGGGGGGSSAPQEFIIVPHAGNGLPGYEGDGGPAIAAYFNFPLGLAVMDDGSELVADNGNHEIRRIAPDGTVSTVAGIGIPGYSGDGGPASEAMFFFPRDVASDGEGGFYVADSENHRVRHVDATGIVRTVAGRGREGFSGDGGPATDALLAAPHGVIRDLDGSVVIADQRNHRVRRVRPDGLIETIAGTGARGFSGDGGPATMARLYLPGRVYRCPVSGRLYVADTYNHRIRWIDGDGVIRTFAGNGTYFADDGGPLPGNDTVIRFPWEMDFDLEGCLLFPDGENFRMRRYDPTTGLVKTIAGNGDGGYAGDGLPALEASVTNIEAVKVNPLTGDIVFGDRSNNRIRMIEASTGLMRTIAGNGAAAHAGDGGPATQASLNDPFGIAYDSMGNLFIGDSLNHCIRIVTPDGIIDTFAGIPGEGGYAGDGGKAKKAKLFNPTGVNVDRDDNIILTDYWNHAIRKIFRTSEIIVTIAGVPGQLGYNGDDIPATEAFLFQPYQTAYDTAGNLYIADSNNNRIRMVTPDGIIHTICGAGPTGFAGDGGPATEALLNDPCGVLPDPFGNVYVTDSHNSMVRVIDPSGFIWTICGQGLKDGNPAREVALNFPIGMRSDAAGNLYVADSRNCRIRKIRALDGIVETVAGDGFQDDLGDFGPAKLASMRSPSQVAVTAAGEILVADTNNHRLRLLK